MTNLKQKLQSSTVQCDTDAFCYACLNLLLNNVYLRSLLAGLSCGPPHITALISFEAALLYLIKEVICSKLVSGVFECLPSPWRVGFLRASLSSFQACGFS